MTEKFHFDGPFCEITAQSFQDMSDVAVTFLRRFENQGVRWVALANRHDAPKLLAMFDALGLPEVPVYGEQSTEPFCVRIVKRPEGVALPALGKARYGLRRCAWCALRLPWWRWDIIPYCDACKPDPRQGGRARLGRRTFVRGSRWDAA